MSLRFDRIIKSIEKLSAAEQERIHRWLDEKGSSNGDNSEVDANRSAKSLRWLDENRERYAGQWVALDGNRLIASGPTAEEVFSRAKTEGVQIPLSN